MFRRTYFLFLLVLTLSFEGLVASSVSAQVKTGTPHFGSFAGGPDVINLANLNAHVTIPVIHKPGRGTNFTYDLTYDTSVWAPRSSSGTAIWTPAANWNWRGVTEIATGYVSYNLWTATCVGEDQQLHNYTVRDTWAYHDPFGAAHAFENLVLVFDVGICSGITPVNFDTAVDGSGYSVSGATQSSAPVYTTAGQKIVAPINQGSGAASSTDRNGNIISVNGSGQFFDTLSSTVPVLAVTGAGTQASPMIFTYTAPSGAGATYKVNYTNYTVATNFGISGTTEYRSAAAVPLVSSVVLPDGTQYSFLYEATPSTPAPGACTPYAGTTCVTARVRSITLPTGGSITYSYSGGNNGILLDGSTATLTRAVSPGGTWIYAQVKNTGAASTTTITDPTTPTPNQTVIQFQGIYETQRQIYQGSATLLKTISTCYNVSVSPCTGTAITSPITQRDVKDIYPTNIQCIHTFKYNSFGALINEYDYDYGPAGSNPLIREIDITLAALGNNISAFRQTVKVKDGGGITKAQTTYNYDETAVVTPTNLPTPQHVGVTGSRGNLTSINYPVSGLTTHYTNFDTGNQKTATDVSNAATTYTYSSLSTTCGNAFPNGVSKPLSMSQSFTWNCTGGATTQFTDENAHNVSTSYTDPYFWRSAAATDQVSATTSLTYTAQTALEATLNFNSGNSTSDRLTTLDGLGRAHVQQTKQSPISTSYDSVETDYDALGRPIRTTLPYSATAGQTTSPTGPGVTTVYDALNRPLTVTDAGGGTTTYSYPNNDVVITVGPAPTGESTKKRQLEYDSLGRLTSVCEITAGTTAWPAGTCAQNVTAQPTGYWTKYAYDALGNLLTVTQNAQAAAANQQTRTYTYDAMRRLTSEKNPEMAQNTMTYVYDTDATCTPTSNGDLVKRTDPVGNTTCYKYDALHRTTSATYSGTYAANSPSKYFVYDAATVNSVVMQNAKTRLAEAYTCTPAQCPATKITDVGLSYSARGELTDVYESTPNSGTTGARYNHTSAQFWPSGALNTLSGPGLPTLTFAPDGEGRIKTISANSGVNPVTATSYNVASQPTSVTLGSSDSDAFQYDPSTFRLTQYKFNVGAQNVTGNLTWNANGSLGTLAITDAFNASDTQTCSYKADDLSRINSANCGAIWGQSFAYDPFGNISKTVLSGSAGTSFLPTYQTSPSITNRIATLPGGITPTYDANGNSTNDSFHQYTWDAENRSVSVNGSAIVLTYDALGRMVEQARGTSYTQIVYSPLGSKLVTMTGTTMQKGFVPLTSGGTVVYNSSGIAYYRHSDNLGSSRFASTPTQTMYSDTAYSAFGEPYAQAGTTDLSFTDQDQDTTAGVYDFLYRKYDPGQSRWISPDPSGRAAANPANPQSWNRYAYVLNNPLGLIDSLGLDCVYLNAAGDDTEFIDTESDSGSCAADGGYWIPGTVDPNNVQIDVNSGWIAATSTDNFGTALWAAGCNGGGCGPSGFPAGFNPFGGFQLDPNNLNLAWIPPNDLPSPYTSKPMSCEDKHWMLREGAYVGSLITIEIPWVSAGFGLVAAVDDLVEGGVCGP
jgi:RHS repeat-associated protein